MSGSSLALDTNQAIAILNDDPAALAFYAQYAELCLPVTVIGELRYGALNSAKVAENLARIDRLVARCRVLNTTDRTTQSYARLRIALKQAAKPIPMNDLWIAPASDEHSLPLATGDAHFRNVASLSLVTPPVP
jgi:tRNA(fMet)-specific endonuclease VapC